MWVVGMNVSEVSRFAAVRGAKRANRSQEWFLVQRVLFFEKERRQREGKKVLGVKAVKRMNIFNGKTPPAPPYWEDRRRVITAWAKLTDRATQIYLKLYWDYQYRFRLAADAFKEGVLDVEFPPGSLETSTLCQLLLGRHLARRSDFRNSSNPSVSPMRYCRVLF